MYNILHGPLSFKAVDSFGEPIYQALQVLRPTTLLHPHSYLDFVDTENKLQHFTKPIPT
jgi:hypothetical protein